VNGRRAWLTRALAGVGAVGVVASVALVGGSACGDATSHVYVGRQYDPDKKCFGDDLSIDVAAGPEPQTPCAPTCITSTFDDAGALEVYVSSMCAPFPNYPWVVVQDAGAVPECQAALAAWALDTTCEPDGAIYNLPDAAGDAAVESGADGSTTPDGGDSGSEDASPE
jgi:hypothetical protein